MEQFLSTELYSATSIIGTRLYRTHVTVDCEYNYKFVNFIVIIRISIFQVIIRTNFIFI